MADSLKSNKSKGNVRLVGGILSTIVLGAVLFFNLSKKDPQQVSSETELSSPPSASSPQTGGSEAMVTQPNLKDSDSKEVKRFYELLKCIEDKTCVEGPDESQPFYQETLTPAYRELKEILNYLHENSISKSLTNESLVRAMRLGESDVQILAAELFVQKPITLKDLMDFSRAFVKFEPISNAVIFELFLKLNQKEKLSPVLTREKIIQMQGDWFKNPDNGPMDFIEKVNTTLLSESEKQELAESLCQYKTLNGVGTIEKIVGLKFDLSHCRN